MASMNQLKQDFLSNLMSQQKHNGNGRAASHSHSSLGNASNGSGSASLLNGNDPNERIRQTILFSKKGYDLRLFLDSLVASKFLCCICKKVCRDAQELSCSNAHIFCKQCIDQHFQVSQISKKLLQCPICHESQDSNIPNKPISFHTSRFVNGHIKGLQVKCIQSHNNISCNWSGRLSDLNQHMSRDCMFNIIQCPFALLGCPQSRLYKYQLNKHISNVDDCNKHISLALQKIKNLKQENSEKSEMNNKMMGQLRAIKAISKNKETKINVMTKELDTIKENHKQLLVEYSKMNDDLENSNHRLSQYEKAVALLKQTNEKLVKEVEILKMQQAHANPMNFGSSMQGGYNNNSFHNSSYGAAGGGGSSSSSSIGGGNGGMTGGYGNGLDLNSLLSGGNQNGNGNNNSNLSPLSQLLGSQSSQPKMEPRIDNNNNNSNSLEYLVSHMSLESEKKTESESNNNNNNNNNLSSKRVLYEFVKMHPDLPKQFNTMAHDALLQPGDDEASKFVRVLLESGKHPQFKKDIAIIVQKLQSNKR